MRLVLLCLKCYKINIHCYYHCCRNYILVIYNVQILSQKFLPVAYKSKVSTSIIWIIAL